MTTRKKILITIELIKIFAKLAFMAATILFIAWIAFSFIEVQIHNATMLNDVHYQYSDINFFGKMMEWFPCK